MEITEAIADSLAPNAAAIKNARGVVLKRKLVGLFRSADGTLLFGDCKGSGAENYRPSADFADSSKPVFRCTCPSRQFPCKHSTDDEFKRALVFLRRAFGDFSPAEKRSITENLGSKRGQSERSPQHRARRKGKREARRTFRLRFREFVNERSFKNTQASDALFGGRAHRWHRRPCYSV